ncbi:DUF3235 domain-containing protein [Corynebacterium bovis]|uniref:resuscitation-promoting factor Rpf1 domain-containing protein n=1 Tax=Corynebacterium bovis TaxID=36808 RepID=UPI00254C4401|nr:resuscitation-promoting factor Rpf1 domain-containing protein [Corynebacterium bovis]MDK8511362.1 DUF3235 domain-containing protein [Corynebacterium bovis]
MGRHSTRSSSFSTSARLAVAGLAVGSLGALVAPAAHAAPDSDWDRLAQCESGGDWAINTGNGFQGGLQFSPSTWSAHGGGEFAATANQASREQQIAVAERVLASQGWGAWPACSASLGLNSGPTDRSAAPAPAPAPAPEQNPAETIVNAHSVPQVDALHDTLVAAAQAAGVEIPQPLEELYHRYRDALESGYAATVEQVRAAADQASVQAEAFRDSLPAPVRDALR